MNDPDSTLVVILPRRGRLLAQALFILVVGIALALFLQGWPAIQTSPLGSLDDAIPLPMVFLAVTTITAAFAWTVLKDSWHHRIELRTEGLWIRQSGGELWVTYHEIQSVSVIPAFGLGLALREFESWLSTQPQAPHRQRQTSSVTHRAWGADITVLSKNMDRPAEQVIDLIQQRLSAEQAG